MDYNVGDIVKLCQEQWRIIEKKLLFPQNLFFIEAINHEEGTVKLRGVEQTLLVSTILPVKIDGIEDRDIFYDPIIAAPTVLPGQEIPVFKRNTSEYYLDGLKNSFNDYGVSYYSQISTFGLKYVHQIHLGQKDKWKKLELYRQEEENCEASKLIASKTPLEEAKIHLHNLHIPASVNAVRRAVEKELKRLLPMNKILQAMSQEGFCRLNDLVPVFLKYSSELGLPSIVPHLQDERQLLLNPFSHDDIETPFYRDELKSAIQEIEELQKIQNRTIVDYPDVRDKQYYFKMSNNGFSFEGKIEFLECFEVYDYNGCEYYSNPDVKLLSSSCEEKIPCKNYRLSALHRLVANSLSYNAKTRPTINSCIS